MGQEVAAPPTANQSRVVVIRIAGKLLEETVNRDINLTIHPNSGRPLLAELAVQWGSAQDVLRNLLPGLPQSTDAPSIAVIDDWDIIKVGRLPTLPLGIGAETD